MGVYQRHQNLIVNQYEFICRCLDLNESRDGLLSEDIESRNWDELIRLADASYLSPALYLGLKRHGLLSLLDSEVQDYFEGIHGLSADRNRRLKVQAIDLIKHLNQAGIKPLLLKGVAGLLDGLYDDIGERVMCDIDVLIEPEQLAQASKMLLENGYYYYKEPTCYDLDMTYKHHSPCLVADGLPASVELHIRPTVLAGRKTLLDNEYAYRAARTLEIDGANALIPAAEFRLLHNFFHSQYQDGRIYRSGRLDVRGLFDWVKLCQAKKSEIDWVAIAKRVERFRLWRSFSVYLLNAEDYFSRSAPQEIKLNQFAWIHCKQQKLLLSNQALTRIYNLVMYLLQSGWNLFSPTVRRRVYGDISIAKGVRLQAGKLLSPAWRKNKVEEICRMA